jgi:hypothetical protein
MSSSRKEVIKKAFLMAVAQVLTECEGKCRYTLAMEAYTKGVTDTYTKIKSDSWKDVLEKMPIELCEGRS